MSETNINTRVIPFQNHISGLGEGPFLDNENQWLYYVDAFAGDVCRLDINSGEVIKRNFPRLVSFVIGIKNEPGYLVFSLWNEIRKLNWETGDSFILSTINYESGQERFNDAKVDPFGRLFVGTVFHNPDGSIIKEGGSLYRLEGVNFIRQSTGFTISNGMAWTNDDLASKLFFNDSEGRKIYSFDYNLESGNCSNRQILIDCDTHPQFVPNEYPDGMVMDKLGYIWTCMYGGARILRIDVDTARVVGIINLATAGVPTSLAFGNYQGEWGCFVTTAQAEDKTKALEDDGKILHVGIIGSKVNEFVSMN